MLSTRDLTEWRINYFEIETNAFVTTATINSITTEIADLKQENTELKTKLDDIINRNMRSNLVFTNVPETKEITSIQQDSFWLTYWQIT